jgi:hypothetical protein
MTATTAVVVGDVAAADAVVGVAAAAAAVVGVAVVVTADFVGASRGRQQYKCVSSNVTTHRHIE